MGRAWVAVLVLGACFTPAPKAGAPCSTVGTCPSPLICAADNTCQTTDVDIDATSTAPERSARRAARV
ncbi:MAG: hypothetical protein M4D80_17655 [Myxococcota bacterium]|nr:hypothetical protein [Myxococcota bacterium]